MKQLTNALKHLGKQMNGQEPTSVRVTEIIDEIADEYTGGGGSGGVSDYNQLSNKPIINEAVGQEYVNGAYYKKADTETIALALNDEIEKIVFDVASAPDFESIHGDWTEVETGMFAKTLIKLTHNEDEIYVIGVYAEFEEGGETIKGNQIMVCDGDPFGGAEPSVFLSIYSTMEGSGWRDGSQGSFEFDATTGEFNWGQNSYVVAVLESVINTYAYEQLGGVGDLCRYIGGELKKLITDDDVTSIESRLGQVESDVSQAQSDISGIKDGQNIDSFADVESAIATIESQLSGIEARLQNI